MKRLFEDFFSKVSAPILGFYLSSLSLFFVNAPQAYAESSTSSKTYVITGSETEIKAAKDAISLGVFENSIQISHDLKNLSGFVFKAHPESLEKIRARLGLQLQVEEDFEVSIADHVLQSDDFSDSSLEHWIEHFGRLTLDQTLSISDAGAPPDSQNVPWGIDKVKALSAFSKSKGAGVIVCTVDTGVDPTHPDLRNNIIGGESIVRSSWRWYPWGDDNGHGTHVAGIIAAENNSFGVVGVAPEAKIFAVKAMDSMGTGYSSGVADGIQSCIQNNAKVINLSLASPSDSALIHKAIQSAVNKGITVVAASGNFGSNVSYPAKYPEVIAVSAINSKSEWLSLSNHGPEIQFTAPGEDVLSTLPYGRYGKMTGTSMASPHVAGVAALALASGKQRIVGDDIGLTKEQEGNGLINAEKSVL